MGVSKLFGSKKSGEINAEKVVPPRSFYQLNLLLNNQKLVPLGSFAGKKILLVNTASDCGFTPQFTELQQLQDKYKDSLVIIGFPANDFKEQEKGADTEIQAFCQVNFGVQFPLAAKSIVTKQEGQNEIFSWLTDKNQNGWNDQPPAWNFTKYLVNEKGILPHTFPSAVSPLSPHVIQLL